MPLHSTSSSSASSSYYSLAGTSSTASGSTYVTIPELDEHKNDFFLQKTRARDITKRRGAIKVNQRLTSVTTQFLVHLTHKTNTIIFCCYVTVLMKSMATNLWPNSSDNQRFVHFVKSFCGDLASRDISAKVSYINKPHHKYK